MRAFGSFAVIAVMASSTDAAVVASKPALVLVRRLMKVSSAVGALTRARLGEAGRRRYEEAFTLDGMLARVWAAYEEVLRL